MMRTTLIVAILFSTLTAFVFADEPGYTDTPLIPGSKWRVHDKERPQPPIVEPGTGDLGVKPPSDAIVLFDGTNFDKWERANGSAVPSVIQDGVFDITKTGNVYTKEEFGDFQLHIEWRAPEIKEGFERTNQGNSGVFMLEHTEVQIMESKATYIYADGNAGAIFGQYPPLVNPARGPLEWQSFNIFFTAPKFDGETLKSPAYLTVIYNGVLVQNHAEVLGAGRHRAAPGPYPVKERGRVMLQNHNSPVEFRNIWIRPLKALP